MREVWADIKGFEGLYQISNFGNVKSFYKDKILKGRSDKDGYFSCFLYINNKGKNYKIHRLVAQTFIPNPNNLPQVNHIDGNKTNNNVNNLEWCDGKINIKHAYDIGLMEKTRKRTSEWSKKNNHLFHSKKVEMFDLKGTSIGIFNSAKEIQRLFNVPSRDIYAVTNGYQKTAYGYTFKKVID